MYCLFVFFSSKSANFLYENTKNYNWNKQNSIVQTGLCTKITIFTNLDKRRPFPIITRFCFVYLIFKIKFLNLKVIIILYLSLVHVAQGFFCFFFLNIITIERQGWTRFYFNFLFFQKKKIKIVWWQSPNPKRQLYFFFFSGSPCVLQYYYNQFISLIANYELT